MNLNCFILMFDLILKQVLAEKKTSMLRDSEVLQSLLSLL